MTVNTNSPIPVQDTFYYETTQGTAPADASAWATAESGTGADRLRVLTPLNAGDFFQAAVPDERAVANFQSRDSPLNGLRNATLSGLSMILGGVGSETSDTNTITEDGVGRFLETVMGGKKEGTASEVDTTVTSARVFDATGSPGYVAGEVFFIEDASASDGLLYPMLVTAFTGGEVTCAWDAPFTPADGDPLHPAVTHYIDANALTDFNDANAKTLSVLHEQGGNRYQASGGVFTMTGITAERGQPPRMEFEGLFAKANKTGDGAPGAPSWSGTVSGVAGRVVGAGTKVAIFDKSGTALVTYDVINWSLDPGFPRTRRETVTEDADGMEGTAGYSCSRASTTLNVSVLIDTEHQDDWDTDTAKRVVIYGRHAAGAAWCVILPNLHHMESPKDQFEAENGMMNLVFEADLSDLAATDMGESRFIAARG